MKKENLKKRFIQDLIIVFTGLGIIRFAIFLNEIEVFMTSLFISTGLIFFGLFDMCLCLPKFEAVQTLEKEKSGLAWIWIVRFGLTIPLCAVTYWALDYPFDIIAEVALGVYTFTGTMSYAWDTTRLMISYLLAFVVIFTILWIIQNSKTRAWGT